MRSLGIARKAQLLNTRFEVDGPVAVVTINRPGARNAVNSATAVELVACFKRFDTDDSLAVAVLTGAQGNFCAGFDLKEVAQGRATRLGAKGEGPMGPTRMQLDKPVIAAIEGYAVAGGLELALWCDLRVAGRGATLGVFNRRFGVPLIDLGTIRLPRLIGEGRALDMILTGRPVTAAEALQIGLVQRLVETGQALEEARAIAKDIARHPQGAVRADRRSARSQWSLSLARAIKAEYDGGVKVVNSGESQAGAREFVNGKGRHGGN
ncbi:MAG TPA: crotonase/enoyl-CoA hydratase family protein [Candidatus Dormibacteraeota bacterium]|nr:crotonase/enoyl-CoA hydratase family protein [Candidatus Dormibacteraeota bacterium]